jgi:hypothetical protein
LRTYETTRADRFTSASHRAKALELVAAWHDAVNDFTNFLRRIESHLPPAYSPSDEPEWSSQIEAKIASLAEDIGFLRDILCVLPVADGEKQPLTPELWGRLGWDVHHGRSIAVVFTSSSSEPSVERATTDLIAIRRDGWLCHRECSWLRVDPDHPNADRSRELAVNWYILETLTAPLYEAWDHLDSGPVISRGSERDATDEEQTAAIAIALTAPETTEERSALGRQKKVRVPRLRLSLLERITTEQFQCEWSQAKGSERKVYRQGEKHFKFGCHEKDPLISAGTINKCLRRLGISLGDFLAACR